jgi:hypothetical protein
MPNSVSVLLGFFDYFGMIFGLPASHCPFTVISATGEGFAIQRPTHLPKPPVIIVPSFFRSPCDMVNYFNVDVFGLYFKLYCE